MASSDKDDKYYTSRKFIYSLLTSFMIVLCAIISGKFPSLGANLPTVIGGLLGALGVYCGVNVMSLHSYNKTVALTSTKNDSPPAPEDDVDDEAAC